jgi:hypothetical protein
MNYDELNHALQLWDQAGERPYEVLIQEHLYERFIRVLESQQFKLTYTIFRGTARHSELDTGDKLLYPYPTSWSSSFGCAKQFIEEVKWPVISSLNQNLNITIKALFNNQNTYNEKEIIIAAITFKILSKEILEGIIIFEVEPV